MAVSYTPTQADKDRQIAHYQSMQGQGTAVQQKLYADGLAHAQGLIVGQPPSAAPTAKPAATPAAAPAPTAPTLPTPAGGGVPPSLGGLNAAAGATGGGSDQPVRLAGMGSEAMAGMLGDQSGALRPLGRRMPAQNSMALAGLGRKVY